MGPDGEIIIWIPPAYRSSVLLPPCTLLIGQSRVTIDLSYFVHGQKWTMCRQQPKKLV